MVVIKPEIEQAPLTDGGELFYGYDLSAHWAWISVAMEQLQLDWQSERLQKFMHQVEQRSGKSCRHPNQLPIKAVIILAKRLASELGREDIGDRFG
jgi:hypothetical protein